MQIPKRWRHMLVAAALTTAGLTGVSQPASASPVVCPTWHNQQDMANTSSPSCRQTWLVEPGRGNFLTRAAIVGAHELYESQGFSLPWLWYAPSETVSLPGEFSTEWTSCKTGTHVADVCTDRGTLAHGLTTGNFSSSPVVMDVFAYNHEFISRVCGNFGTPLRSRKAPEPKITVHKFNDLNGNRVQDAGEPPLSGWSFQLIRRTSLFKDQDPGLIRTLPTDADGNLTFLLDSEAGPGTYTVQEVPQDDWAPTTDAAQTVVVPDGVGDDTVASLQFGNVFQAITASGTAISPTEGAQFTGSVASFTDPDLTASAGEYASTVDWGDGTLTGDGAITKTGDGAFVVTGTHTYAEEGTKTVTVAIVDVGNAANSATVSTAATIGDAGLTAGSPAAVGAVEGAAFTATVGTFADANPGGSVADFTATTVDWGDGSSSAGTVSGPPGGPFTVAGTHKYTEEGTYPVTVGVLDDGGAATTLNATADVADAPLTAAGYPNLFSTNPVTGLAVATFTDANPGGTVADFTATTVDWGDGSTGPGTVSGPPGGPFTVTGSHTYATLGPKTIVVHIVDEGGSKADPVSHLMLYAPPSGGDFVIGDAGTANGAHVNFWGSQWAKHNPLTVTPPAAFKGFEDNPLVPSCGGTWTSRPGNSSNPPGTVPTYMSVIVSTHVEQRGSTMTGDVTHVVIVATDPGYAGNPGHEGIGTVVATLC